MLVDLVGEDEQVVFDGDLGDADHGGAVEDGTGGVVRGVDDEHACSGTDGTIEGLGVDRPPVAVGNQGTAVRVAPARATAAA